MKYIIILLSLIPLVFMSLFFLYGVGIEWFDALVVWLEKAFSFNFPVVHNKLYYLSKISGLSALWLLIFAFWVQPLRTYLRFDLVEFKKLLGAFAVGYGVLHLVLFIAAHNYSLVHIGELFLNHLFLAVGFGALAILTITPNVKSWNKIIYIGVVLVIIHLLLGYRTLEMSHIIAISLLSLGLALRLIKR